MKTLFVFAAFGVMLTTESFAGIGDGMVFWLRGGSDNPASGHVGYLDEYEFPDALRASSGGQTWSDKLFSYGAAGAPASYDYVPFKDLEVIEPATGRSLGMRTCLDVNQQGLTTNNCQFASLKDVSTYAFPTNSLGWTFFVRCRPLRSPVTPTSEFVLVNFLNYYSTGGSGLMIKFKDYTNPSGSSNELGDNVKPIVQIGGASHAISSMTAFKTNRWTDILVSIKGLVARAYVVSEGGSLFKEEWQIAEQDFAKKSYEFYLGAYQTGVENNKKYHGCGQISDVVYWNRDLSEDEARDFLQYPQTEYARVGVQNGSSGEFAASGSGCVTNGTWGEWRDFPATLSDGKTAAFAFELPENYENVNQILCLTAVPGSPVGKMPVKLNGASAGGLTFASGSRRACLILSKEYLVAGTNIVEIGAGAMAGVEIDAVSVGGGWQIGAMDGKGDGNNANLYAYTYDVGRSSSTNLATALRKYMYWGTSSPSPSSWSYLTQRNSESFRFRIPDSFFNGANNAFRFVFRPLKASMSVGAPRLTEAQEYTYRLYANGVAVGSAKAPALSPATLKFIVPVEVLDGARECVLKIVNETQPWYLPTDYYYDSGDPDRKNYEWGCYYWNAIDYFSLEPYSRKGTVLVVR